MTAKSQRMTDSRIAHAKERSDPNWRPEWQGLQPGQHPHLPRKPPTAPRKDRR
jgi:hypothetical protein